MPVRPAASRAPVPTSPDALRAGEELVRVRAGAFRLLVPLRHVERVLPAALPAARPAAAAAPPVVALPGELVPLVFASAILGADEARLAPDHQMVLLGGGAGRALLWVDGVEDVVPHAAAPEGPGGPLVAGWSDPALPTAVLDVPRLLSLACPGTEP